MFYLGIDVGGTNLVAGLSDEAGRLLAKESCPVASTLSAKGLCESLVALGQRVCVRQGVPRDEIAAVGIGLPGLVDHRAGVFLQNPNLPFAERNVPVRALFQQGWDVPVHLANDANCAAIGEYWAGAAKGYKSAAVVTLGTGIGGGLVNEGKLHTGFGGGAMELGHMITHPGGLPCGCGGSGCWEKYGSATALIQAARQAMQDNPDSLLWSLCGQKTARVEGRTIFQAAGQGDKTALAVLSRFWQELSIGLINLVNMIQPEIICLGGGMSEADPALLLTPVEQLVLQGSFDKIHPPRMVRAALGNDAGVVGAAMLCRVL